MLKTPEQVTEAAKARLVNNAETLRLEIEYAQKTVSYPYTRLTVRGGNYTESVRNIVIQEMGQKGWKHEFDGYWLVFTPRED